VFFVLESVMRITMSICRGEPCVRPLDYDVVAFD
jgi:hypothetical protein